MANEISNSEYQRVENQLLSPLAKDSSLEWKEQSETEVEEASVSIKIGDVEPFWR